LKAQFINPYTDFGFKKLFGEEASKDLLIDFLNQLLPAKHRIVELSFKNSEQQAENKNNRKAIFDLHCQNDRGDRFIVEMQKAKIKFFKDRALFYSTFPIKEQAEKGEWDFKLNPVYCVAILDFVFDDNRQKKNHITNIQLKDQFCQTFYDKLTFIYIEMPRFQKEEHQLENRFDKWLYFLKYLEDFDHIPAIFEEEVFLKGFEIARIANYNEKEMAEYENSLKYYRDLKGVVDNSYEEGLEEGKEVNQLAVIKNSLKEGLDIDLISRITGVPVEEIKRIKEQVVG